MTALEYLGLLPYEPIEQFDDPAKTLVHPILRSLYAYWDSCRGNTIGPAHRELDPTGFRNAVGWVSLFDVRKGVANFEVHVLGGNVATVFEQKPGFRTPADADDPEFHQVAIRELSWVADKRTPLRIFRDLQTARRRYRYEAVILPLSDDGEKVDFLLAAAIPPLGG